MCHRQVAFDQHSAPSSCLPHFERTSVQYKQQHLYITVNYDRPKACCTSFHLQHFELASERPCQHVFILKSDNTCTGNAAVGVGPSNSKLTKGQYATQDRCTKYSPQDLSNVSELWSETPSYAFLLTPRVRRG